MSLVVHVQTLGSLLPITISAAATVRDLKARLQAIDSSFVVRRQKLFITTEDSDSNPSNQIELHNNQTLASYQITGTTQVVLIMVPKPAHVRFEFLEIDRIALENNFDELLNDEKLCAISVKADVICEFKNKLLSLVSQNRSIRFARVGIEGKFVEAQQIRFCKSFISKRPDIELKLCIHKTEGGVVQQILEICKFNLMAVKFQQSFELFALSATSQSNLKSTLQSLTSLILLDLSHNELNTPKCASLLASALPSLVQLQDLDLSETKLDDSSCQILAPALRSLTSIGLLDLHHNKIGDIGCIALAPALLSMTSITELNLNHNRIGSAGCAALAPALQMMASLESLSLNQNQIGDEGWIALAHALPSLTSVRELNFNDNQLDDPGCAALAVAFQSMTSLESLDFHGNQIGCDGCKALASVLPKLTALKSLELTFNEIGKSGCVALANNLPLTKSLKSFSIMDNPLICRDECLDLLASALRHTRISWEFNDW
jgi:Ran GTPase-activating protein (RanGAP) involved in mRNA processing and transport